MTPRPFECIDDGSWFPLFHLELLPRPSSDETLTGSQRSEFMGSKRKFWIHNELTGQRALVKYARPGTGEHWSEKIAAEVAALLEIPHPPVEVGFVEDAPVSLTLGFLQQNETLIHGNELLAELDQTYPKDGKNYRTVAHTISAVQRALIERAVAPPRALPNGLSAFGAFVGYLLLDALVGNTDRHHENWAIVLDHGDFERTLTLAPSYDHASSLGRELTDQSRSELLRTKDRRRIHAYLERTRSALHSEEVAEVGQGKPLSCLEAWQLACAKDRDAAQFWLERLLHVSRDRLLSLPKRIPAKAMSPVSKEFATFLLGQNYDRLCALGP